MRGGLWVLRGVAGLALIAGLAGVCAPSPWLPPILRLADYEWLFLIAAGWTLGWLAVVGRPRSVSRWGELLGWLALFVGVAAAQLSDAEAAVIAWGLMLTLRGALIAAWMFVVFGVPVVIVGLRQRRRINDRQPWLLGRLWFATALTLGLLEPACAVWETWQATVLQKHHAARLQFPSTLPPPPPGEWHLAALGESTMQGWPYQPHSSFLQMAVWRLQQQAPHNANRGEPHAAESAAGPSIVVHNLAVPGINLPMAIHRLQDLRHRPHVLLVYCGHNEFYHEMIPEAHYNPGPFPVLDGVLDHSPTFRVFHQLLESRFPLVWRTTQWRRALVDRPLFVERYLARRLERFRSRLEQLAEFCRREQIVTIWFVPAASEIGFEPNRSLVRPGTSAADRQTLVDEYAEARAAEQRQDWARAAEIYRQGLAEQPEFAEFHFRLGRCLMEQGEYAEAQPHLAAALEFDGHPVRMPRGYREAVREVARTHGFPIIDVEAVLRPATPHGILDRTVFLDDVHPTLKGQFLLGCALAETLREPFAAICGHEVALRPVTVRDAVTALGLDAEILAAAYDQLANGLDARVILRFDRQERSAEARQLRTIVTQLRTGALSFDATGVDAIDDTACPPAGH
jgi:tetratricopeptide (TPR) repeat protein